jgi:uncharacterized membrane protein YkoI
LYQKEHTIITNKIKQKIMNQTTPFAKFIVVFAAVIGVFYLGHSFGKEVKSQTVTAKNSQNRSELASLAPNTKDSDQEKSPNPAISSNAIAYLEDNFPVRADAVKWEMRNYGYEAIFEKNGRAYEVEFDKNGNWLETELEDVPAVEIPTTIIQTVKREFPNARIQEFEIELTPKGTFYEVEIGVDNREKEMYYDSQGKRTENTNEDR